MGSYLLFSIFFIVFAKARTSNLLDFKSALPSPSVLPKWLPNNNHCSFNGVKCKPGSNAVNSVDLANIPLGTNFTVVAKFLLSIETLQVLSLRGANVSGAVAFPPGSHCSSLLTHLDFSENKLSGTVSDLESFGLCPRLVGLNVSSNAFTFPTYNVSLKLETLDLSFNYINGDVLGHLFAGGCGGLQRLSLRGNTISSMNFSTCWNCPSLIHLDISRNNFSGFLPSCTSLYVFDASFNNFFGELSVEKFGKSLKVLNLSSNNFAGRIPAGICELAELEILYLQDNNLVGEIPPAIGNCSRLTALHLSFNYLSGRIPSTLGNLSSLRDLKLWFNLLEGEIPRELTRVKTLESLILDFNYLNGSIPDAISNCENLGWLSLSDNMLGGKIPSSLGNLPHLAILKLSNNSFSGEIPPELGDCASLIWLDLSTNLLSGSIPSQLFKQSGNIAVNFIRGKRYVYLRYQRNDYCRGTGNLLEFEGMRDHELDRISSRLPCGFDRIYAGLTQPTFDNNGSMIYLDLSSNKLSGAIPKEIGAMLYLYILNIGNNNISGSIPSELGQLKGLNILYLSFNKISGVIPQSLTGLSLLNLIDLSNNDLTGTIPEAGQLATLPARSFLNNSGLCGIPLSSCDSLARSPGNSPRSRRRQSPVAGSVAMGTLFAVLCIIALIVVVLERKKRNRKQRKDLWTSVFVDGNSELNTGLWKLTAKDALSASLVAFEKPLRKMGFADLIEATHGFRDDCLIGSGGFGDVYKAELKDGMTVAVKKLKHVSGQGDREFTAEMETIGKIKHRNLVTLLGYCKVGDERLLVYEYLKHGSLEDVLHNNKKHGMKLRWAERRNIAVGAARGLAFLHHSCIPHIIHRDMKSSNVLLDEHLEARVSDFGMARLMSAMDTHLSVSTLAGTPGYVPPEYYQSFRCSTSGDVYSYGVVLLELLTGKRPTDSSDFGDNNLVGWVKQHAKMKISDVFDASLVKEDQSIMIELLQHLKVATACLDDRPWRRPTMIQVMAMFKEIEAGCGIHSISSSKEERFTSVDTSIKENSEVTQNI